MKKLNSKSIEPLRNLDLNQICQQSYYYRSYGFFFCWSTRNQKVNIGKGLDKTHIVVPLDYEIFMGTKFTQFMFLIRPFFVLIKIESMKRFVIAYNNNEPLGNFCQLLGYLRLARSVILIDYRTKITNKALDYEIFYNEFYLT